MLSERLAISGVVGLRSGCSSEGMKKRRRMKKRNQLESIKNTQKQLQRMTIDIIISSQWKTII